MPKALHQGLGDNAIALATAATALPFPPAAGCAVPVPDWDGNGTNRAMPELDFEIWAAGDVNLTVGTIYGGVLKALVNADDTFTAANGTEILTATAHGLHTGDGPFTVSNSGGALPAGLTAATDYWVIKINADTFYLATSLANALAGTKVFITTDGTGTQTISDKTETMRLYWMAYGLIGPAADGAVALLASATNGYKGWTQRIGHRPHVVAYALTATLSSAVATSVAIYGTQDWG